MRPLLAPIVVVSLAIAAVAAGGHIVVLGGATSVKAGSGQQIKVRPIVVDGRVKDYSTGTAHQVTENLFVVRRVSRINNALPNESPKHPLWAWDLGGWISVSSTSGRITELKLPDFDPHSSDASWFQDYAAYCGASEDKSVRYMVVF